MGDVLQQRKGLIAVNRAFLFFLSFITSLDNLCQFCVNFMSSTHLYIAFQLRYSWEARSGDKPVATHPSVASIPIRPKHPILLFLYTDMPCHKYKTYWHSMLQIQNIPKLQSVGQHSIYQSVHTIPNFFPPRIIFSWFSSSLRYVETNKDVNLVIFLLISNSSLEVGPWPRPIINIEENESGANKAGTWEDD